MRRRSGVRSPGSVKRSPPCTTRCPTTADRVAQAVRLQIVQDCRQCGLVGGAIQRIGVVDGDGLNYQPCIREAETPGEPHDRLATVRRITANLSGLAPAP